MTPADKRELCAILRRVLLKQASKSLHAAINEIDAIEKEIEPVAPWCPYGGLGDGVVCRETRGHVHDGNNHGKILLDNPEEPCPTPSSETSGAPTGTPARPVGTATIAPTTTSLPTDNPPGRAAIRQAFERLRVTREACSIGSIHDQSTKMSEIGARRGECLAAVDTLLQLDVPVVVARYDRDVTRFMEARDSWQQRAEAAEARADKAERELTNVALTLEVMSNGVKKAEQERDAARKERDEARDKALEDAAVYLDTLKMYGTQAKLAAAIRGMKGKP